MRGFARAFDRPDLAVGNALPAGSRSVGNALPAGSRSVEPLTEPHPGLLEASAAFGDNEHMDATILSTGHPDASTSSQNERPRATRLSIEVVDELRRRVRSGQESIAAAARRLERSENAVRRAVRTFDRTSGSHSYKDANEPDVPARACGRPPRVPEGVVRAIRAAKGSKSGASVAREHGVTASYVSRIWKGLNRLDVEDAPVSVANVERPEAAQ